MISSASSTQNLGSEKAFRQAVSNGDLTTAETLLADVNVNSKGPDSGKTALHFASMKGHVAVVKWLVENGADINARDNQGNSPLMLSLMHCQIAVADELLRNKPDVLEKNNLGLSPLMYVYSDANVYILNHSIKLRIQEQIPQKQQPGNKMLAELMPDGDLRLYYNQDAEAALNRTRGKHSKIELSDGKALAMDSSFSNVLPIQSQQKSYRLPPLVFLMDHRDAFSFNITKLLLPYLKTLGYKAVCLEFDESLDANQTMAMLNTFCKRHAKELPSIKLHHDFIKHAVDNGMGYHGIDANLGELRDTPGFGEVVPESKKLNDAREEIMAKQCVDMAERYDGGIIVFMGAAHVEFSSEVAAIAGPKATQFQFLGTTYLSEIDDITSKVRMMSLTNGIPLEQLDTTKSLNDNASVVRKLVTKWLKKSLTNPDSLVKYDHEIDSSFILTLRQHFSDAKGLFVNETGTFDALIPVDTIENAEGKAKALTSILDMQPTLCYAQRGSTATQQLGLRVMDVNTAAVYRRLRG